MSKNISQKTQLIIFTIICLISISVLSGCQNSDLSQQSDTLNNTNQENNTIYNTTNIQTQTLVLDHHGCIWCGICAQVAPQNFDMQGRKATVVSQENINNQEVKNAIDACPVSVIEIIEA